MPDEKMFLDILSKAVRTYWDNIGKSLRARRFVKERGLTAESLKRYGLGYAESSKQALRKVFPNYHVPALAEVGLVKNGEHGLHDFFRDRIIFPILNDHGRVIAFGGRKIDGDGPKYLNSPQSSVFEKNSVLFGLPQARESIEATGEAIVMEGYMDVVMSAQYGVRNVVATMGTATTEKHLHKLLNVGAKRIIFCFDGDQAGRKAATEAMRTCFCLDGRKAINAVFVFLPENEDPDSFMRNHGVEKFKDVCRNATSLQELFMEQLRKGNDLATCEGRANLAQAALEILAQIRDAEMYYRLCEVVAEDSGFSVAEIIQFSGNSVQRVWHDKRETTHVAEQLSSSSDKLNVA